jgi:hypothetical protein
VCTTEYHRSSKLQAIEALLRSPTATSGTQQSNQIKKGRPQTVMHLCSREILGLPPLFRSGPHAADHPRLAKVAAGDTKSISLSSGDTAHAWAMPQPNSQPTTAAANTTERRGEEDLGFPLQPASTHTSVAGMAHHRRCPPPLVVDATAHAEGPRAGASPAPPRSVART